MTLTTRLALLLGSAVIAGCASDPEPRDSDGGLSPVTPFTPETLCAIDVACWGNILNEPKAPCGLTITDGEGGLVYEGAAGLELRGRSSLTFPKPQYGVELREHTELPVWPGSTWSFLDDGSDPGPGWSDTVFDDSAWSIASAPLGYGADYLSTTVASSTTTYFRIVFDVQSAASSEDVEIGLLRTDGVAIYLNGVEILRDGLAVGATTDTWATASVSAADAIDWMRTDLDPTLLVDGPNVLAVEIHQAEDTTDDLRFDLYLEASTERESDLFGMGLNDDWILNGQYVDRALFRNRLAFDLFQSLGGTERYAPESTFCELTLNGEPQGVYTFGEKIGRSEYRLPLGHGGEPGDSFIVKLDEIDGFHPNAVGRGTWQMVYPNTSDEAVLAKVGASLASWEAAVTGPNAADPDLGIFGLLDIESTVDFVILEEFMKNADAYQLSVHLSKAPDGKLYFTPWDLDLSMGYPNTDCGFEGWNPRDYQTTEGVVPITYIQEIADVLAFRTTLAERWWELREGVLSEASLLARIAAYDVTLAPAIEENFALWPIESIAFSTDDKDDWLCPVDSYEEEHARLLAFVTGRLAWMDANIDSF